jgi:hypothetical protein
VKHLPCILPFVLVAVFSASAQVRPIPPGVRQADQADAQTEKNIPPGISQHVHLDIAKLHHDAYELARISQTIPSDVDSIQRNILPKDMTEKLKQIEKLSKQMRSLLNP